MVTYAIIKYNLILFFMILGETGHGLIIIRQKKSNMVVWTRRQHVWKIVIQYYQIFKEICYPVITACINIAILSFP